MKKKILLITTCFMLLLSGCSSKENEKTETKKETVSKNVKIDINENEKVSIEKIINANNEVIFTITNKTDALLDYLNIDVAFYNKKGNLIRTEKQFVRNLGAKGIAVIKMYLANGIDVEVPSKVEVALNPTIYETKFETVYTDKVTGIITKSETEGQLNLTINNTSGATINDVSAAVVFYKDKKIVDIYSVNAQNVGKTINQVVYIPTVNNSENMTYIEYDDVRVIINSASSYNQ